MNKKGFTLIEILCVIVLLSLIACVASASILKFSQSSKEKLYCTKMSLIKTAAQNYGYNNEYELDNSSKLYENNPSLTITINDLVKSGNLKSDKDSLVLNPIDDTSLNDTKIIIYKLNNQIKVLIENDNIC